MNKILPLIVAEPLTWFLALAILIFAADRHLNPETRAILVDQSRQNEIAVRWTAQMGTDPSNEQLAALTEDWLIEELFYREALRLNLNENDLIIRRRLVQKYGFLVEQVSDESLSEEAIEAFYRSNLVRYEAPLRFSFEQILLSEPLSTPADALEVLEKLRAGMAPQNFAKSTLLPAKLTRKSFSEVDFTFGPGFATQLNLALTDTWQGPINSAYGQHMVSITALEASRTLELTEISDKVRYDLLQSLKQAQRREAAERLKARYPVVYETNH